MPLDATQAAWVTDAVGTIRRNCGRLEILYNNAGGTQPGDTLLTDRDEQVFWSTVRAMQDRHLSGLLECEQIARKAYSSHPTMPRA